MSVLTPASLPAFADLIANDIQNIYVKRSDRIAQMEKYFNVGMTNSYYQKDSSVTGVGKSKFVGMNASVQYDAPLQGFDKTYTQKKYAHGIEIDEQCWKYGINYRKITNIVETLADGDIDKIEEDAADMLNNGYSTSYSDSEKQTISTAGGDSAAYFTASHTREDGGTAWNNIVYDGTTYNMDFEYDALKALRKTASAVVGPRGQQLNSMPDTIVAKTGSSVQDRYEELLANFSKNAMPGGNDNDGTAKVGLPKAIFLKDLDNDAYWFAFDSSKKNDVYGLQWLWSEKPHMLAPEIVYDTQLYKRQSIMFYDRGGNDMRYWYASNGTNT